MPRLFSYGFWSHSFCTGVGELSPTPVVSQQSPTVHLLLPFLKMDDQSVAFWMTLVSDTGDQGRRVGAVWPGFHSVPVPYVG